MKELLKEKAAIIDRALDAYLPPRDNLQSVIYDAMRYSLFAGGKRLRPILMLETAKMCGGAENEVLPFACAMEMIHTYSLIHDDLPAMDNDDLRRGKPTNHIKYGEAVAILAGDALLNKAFEIVSEYGGKNPARAMKAVSILAKSSGTEGMIGGQIVDMESEGKEITRDTLEYLHSLKTGAIIRSSCVIGAVVSDADEALVSAADEFARNLGIAFQIRDDILDVTGDEAELGKPIGSDARENKNTYVTLYGLKRAEELSALYSKRQFMSNSVFITALLGWFAAQVLKIILSWDKKLDFKRIVGSGGMPSSHASFVMALTMAVGFESGFDSPLFAISAVMSFVVMYDAAGIRRSAGQQAAILNKLVESLVKADRPKTEKRLKELLGHTPIEVFGGAILGIIIAIIRHA